MTSLKNVTDEVIHTWFDNVNVKGWYMTIQGHPIFAVHKGPLGTGLLSEDAYDKFSKSPTAKHISDLEWKQRIYFISKGSKPNRYTDAQLIRLYTPIYAWSNYPGLNKIEEKIIKSGILEQVWARCIKQVKSIKVQTDTKKDIAVKYIHGMFDPIYQSSKKKFRLTDDECLQAFEDAIELLKVKMVMGI